MRFRVILSAVAVTAAMVVAPATALPPTPVTPGASAEAHISTCNVKATQIGANWSKGIIHGRAAMHCDPNSHHEYVIIRMQMQKKIVRQYLPDIWINWNQPQEVQVHRLTWSGYHLAGCALDGGKTSIYRLRVDAWLVGAHGVRKKPTVYGKTLYTKCQGNP